MRRRVGCRIELQIHGRAQLAFQIAVAEHPGLSITEQLTITADGFDVEPRVLRGAPGGRVHWLGLDGGRVVLDYLATVDGLADSAPADQLDSLAYLRPSRYAPSDHLVNFARYEFAGVTDPRKLLDAVSSWVANRIRYAPGSSVGTDGALETLLSGRGVCRDYAHLVVTLLRALDLPARFAAVYAPGLMPMDFHAVPEALVEGTWRVVDPTGMAPRQSLLRIATGRDAADTAFLSNYGATVDFIRSTVSASVDGDLVLDDLSGLVSIQ